MTNSELEAHLEISVKTLAPLFDVFVRFSNQEGDVSFPRELRQLVAKILFEAFLQSFELGVSK